MIEHSLRRGGSNYRFGKTTFIFSIFFLGGGPDENVRVCDGWKKRKRRIRLDDLHISGDRLSIIGVHDLSSSPKNSVSSVRFIGIEEHYLLGNLTLKQSYFWIHDEFELR